MLKLPATAAWLHYPGPHWLQTPWCRSIRAFSHFTSPHLTRVRVGFRAVQVPEPSSRSLSLCVTYQPYSPPRISPRYCIASASHTTKRRSYATCAPFKHTLARTLSHPMSPPTSDVSTSKGQVCLHPSMVVCNGLRSLPFLLFPEPLRWCHF